VPLLYTIHAGSATSAPPRRAIHLPPRGAKGHHSSSSLMMHDKQGYCGNSDSSLFRRRRLKGGGGGLCWEGGAAASVRNRWEMAGASRIWPAKSTTWRSEGGALLGPGSKRRRG
jgi:hypothetical protein